VSRCPSRWWTTEPGQVGMVASLSVSEVVDLLEIDEQVDGELTEGQ
jgi:hypothetical protein